MYYRGLIQRGDLDINPLMTAMTRCFLGQGMWNLTKNKKTNNSNFFPFFLFLPFFFYSYKNYEFITAKNKKMKTLNAHHYFPDLMISLITTPFPN